jgi:tRNA(adenine34) deaminase
MNNAAWSEKDIEFMRAALAEAEVALGENEIPVGAVVVESGQIISRGHNCAVSKCDPSGHAEIVALRAAGAVRNNYRLAGATLYVTLEPCVMCVGALVHARVGRVVFAAYDDKAGALGSKEDLSDSCAFNHRFEVNGGVLADDAAALLTSFFEARR